MQFFRRAPGRPSRLGILPGTFNPVTVAHLALARSALSQVQEVVFVLPRVFPHKPYSGASFEARIELLGAAVGEGAFSIATADGGLFVEIAEECRATYGTDTRLSFLCGRDAAERIAGWDYGRPDAFGDMLRHFDLLVAARDGAYDPPEEFRAGIAALPVDCDVDGISATEVRERIARGEAWEELVPAGIREQVRWIYGSAAPGRH